MSAHLTVPETFRRRDLPAERAELHEQEFILVPNLLEMVRLRVAQVCNCQLCMDAHREALKARGESDERIEQLSSWRESPLYDERERIALAVSEVLGENPPRPVSKDVVRAARSHFNDAELLQLTVTVFAVNDWSHLCIH